MEARIIFLTDPWLYLPLLHVVFKVPRQQRHDKIAVILDEDWQPTISFWFLSLYHVDHFYLIAEVDIYFLELLNIPMNNVILWGAMFNRILFDFTGIHNLSKLKIGATVKHN